MLTGSSEMHVPFRLSNQKLYVLLILSILATYPTHLNLLDFVIITVFDEEYKL
jgi:hypothetical protein